MEATKHPATSQIRAPATARRSADRIREDLIGDFMLGLRQAATNVGHTKREADAMTRMCWDLGGDVNVGLATTYLKNVIEKGMDEKTVDDVAIDAAGRVVRFLFFDGKLKDATLVAKHLGIEDRLTEEKGRAHELAVEAGDERVAVLLRSSEIIAMLPDFNGNKEFRLADHSDGNGHSSLSIRE